jgi:hypothetical protein
MLCTCRPEEVKHVLAVFPEASCHENVWGSGTVVTHILKPLHLMEAKEAVWTLLPVIMM